VVGNPETGKSDQVITGLAKQISAPEYINC